MLERTAWLAQGVPGIVVALALVSLTLDFAEPLYQTSLLLVLAYAILFLPLGLVSVRSALLQAQAGLEDAGRALGLGPLATLWRVTLPLAGPGLGAAASLVFVSVLTELTATLLLAPIGVETLATQVWADTSTLAFAAAAPYAALMVACSLGSTWLLCATLRGRRARGSMTQPAELRVEGLGKAFGGDAVLRDVSLSVPAGKLTAILGASGSGKTTLLRLICGFERADGGSITLAGAEVAGPGLHVPPERRRVGYVAQEGALFPHLSVADNVLFGLPRRDRRDVTRAAALLERVGLPASYAGRGPHQLSGGEQQRVALARALAPGPRIVLLDEPFSALDAALRMETRLAVAASLAEAGATAILVTHDQGEALSLGQQVGVLREGVLVQMDTPEMLYRRPVDVALARFVGEAFVLPGDAQDMMVTCCLGRLAQATSARGPVSVLIRPEQLRLGHGNTIAQVETVRFYGPDAAVTLRLKDGTTVSARVAGYAVPTPGETIAVSVEGQVVTFPRT